MSAPREFWVNAYALTGEHQVRLGARHHSCCSATAAAKGGGLRVPYRIHVRLKPKSEAMPS